MSHKAGHVDEPAQIGTPFAPGPTSGPLNLTGGPLPVGPGGEDPLFGGLSAGDTVLGPNNTLSGTGADFQKPPGTEETIQGTRFIWSGTQWISADVVLPGSPLAQAHLTTFLVPETARQRAAPLLTALGELQEAQEPGVRRRAFAPIAERGFGLSGLAERGVREALGEFEAQFAGERARIKSTALQQALEEIESQQQIAAVAGT